MNAGGHIAVAAQLAARSGHLVGPGVLLGAALPDLASMGRFRLTGRTSHPGLSAGIRLHHRTDDEFHHHRWFRHRNRRLAAELAASGVERGPSRACSHVGIELLLDGKLLASTGVAPAADEAFDGIAGLRDDLASLVAERERERWLTHLDALACYRLPADYGDPEAVAQRLHRILTRRPRLALSSGAIPAVSAALARHKPEIDRSALRLVDELVARLHGASPGAAGR